jgi:hypothetical protein
VHEEDDRASAPELTDEEANEISDGEAARTLGRKRRRRSMREKSPELGSGNQEEEEEEEEGQSEDEPVRKRTRGGRPPKSPATQKQPAAPRRKAQPAAQTKRKTQAKPTPKPKGQPRQRNKKQKQKQTGGDDEDGEANEASTLPIDITVQRFVNLKDNDDGAADPLQAAATIPYINHSGESAVDVFAQVCEEVIGYTLAQYEELASNTDEPARKKECRVKVRALEAYREELSSRSLQHVGIFFGVCLNSTIHMTGGLGLVSVQMMLT